MKFIAALAAIIALVGIAVASAQAEQSRHAVAIERVAVSIGIAVVPKLEQSRPAPVLAACCRVCSKGKACGNSCIQASKTCHQRRGCACNSYAPSLTDAGRPLRWRQ